MSAVAVVSLAFFLIGLVLGVIAMLHGTGRHPAVNRSTLAAFAFAFGLTGYLLERSLTWPWWGVVLLALGVGGSAFGLQTMLIARWAIPSERADAPDPRYLLQGTLARMVREATAEHAGELTYELDGHQCTLPARSLDGTALAAGADVVIDRVEHGVAYAELWVTVEQRL